MLPVLLAFLSVTLTVNGQLIFDDPCTVVANGPLGNEDHYMLTVPSECINGSIWWEYPRATLEVQFHQDDLFAVCLEQNLMPFVQGISQLVNGNEEKIEMKTGGQYCTSHLEKDVTLLIKEPSRLTLYVGIFHFRLIMHS